MSAGNLVGIGLLLVVMCGVGAVHIRHESRNLHMQLESLRDRRDALEMDWNRLQLELSTLAAPALVDQVARARLDMSLPDPEQIVYLRP